METNQLDFYKNILVSSVRLINVSLSKTSRLSSQVKQGENRYILYSRKTVIVVDDHKGVSGNIKLSQILILVYWCISKIQELS